MSKGLRFHLAKVDTPETSWAACGAYVPEAMLSKNARDVTCKACMRTSRWVAEMGQAKDQPAWGPGHE